MERAIWVTGADGFVGRWLLAEIERRGQKAAALSLTPESLPAGLPATRLDLERAAAADPGAAVIDLEALPPPEGLIHLAAMSFPPECEAHPERARAVNVVGPARLYEQVLRRWPELPVVHVSSGQVYRPQAAPLREDQEVVPVNVYGATKLQGEAVALGWRDRGGRVCVARPFNHTGAGQVATFALPSFALRLAALEREGGGVLEVGRLDSIRDFLHARQVAALYLDLLGRAGEIDLLNVCSGRGWTIGELLDGLLGLVRVEVELRQDSSRLRGAGDADALVGDPRRLASLFGAAPELDAPALWRELLDDARARLQAGETLERA